MSSDLFFIRRVASRWASVDFESRYSRLLLAMSLDQAKKVLGFPPGANPSEEEIKKNYKTLAIQNHPDRGGDLDKMVEINVAKDVLTGKSAPSRGTPAPSRDWKVPKEPEPDSVMEGQDFSAAWSANAPPPGVEWKFVSITEFYWEQSFYPSHRIWTMYGRTDSKHIFCAFKYRGESSGTIPTDLGSKTKVKADWQVSWVAVPLTQPLEKIAAKYIKSVATAWTDAKPDAPRKFLVWTHDKPTEQILKKIPNSGGVALKVIVADLAAPTEGSPSTGKQSIIEVYAKYSTEKRERVKAKGEAVRFKADTYDFFVRINGREVQLADETVKNLEKDFIPYVMTWDFKDGKPYNLNRLRGGRTTLKLGPGDAMLVLAKGLTSEPSWVRQALEETAATYATEKRASKLLEFRAEMTLKQASESIGISMLELLEAIHE